MFFFALAVFSCCLWMLPWWCLNLLALLLGGLNQVRGSQSAYVAGAGAIAMAGLAFIKDGQSAGMISTRVSGLFHLPAPWLIFLVMAVLGGVSAWLSYLGGTALRSFFR